MAEGRGKDAREKSAPTLTLLLMSISTLASNIQLMSELSRFTYSQTAPMILPAQPPFADIFDITRQTMVMDGITLKILGEYNSRGYHLGGRLECGNRNLLLSALSTAA